LAASNKPPLDSPVVMIAADVDVSTLQAQPGFDRDILVFAETDSLKAMEAIAARKPHMVVITRSFVDSSRGAAIVNHLRTDPSFGQAEIRLIEEPIEYMSLVARRSKKGLPPNSAVPGHPLPDDYRGTRLADRFVIDREVEVKLDGDQSRLIDLSPTGAQLVSGSSMRPGQRVRLSLAPNKDDAMRLVAMVAWAAFEPASAGRGAGYRVGIHFMDADAKKLNSFCQKYRAPGT
jgi:hypothetical protein|tara:strand:- start:1144 stop:1842 length:699 start_codon:yes stop_codon:yes gene_type:complete